MALAPFLDGKDRMKMFLTSFHKLQNNTFGTSTSVIILWSALSVRKASVIKGKIAPGEPWGPWALGLDAYQVLGGCT